MEKGMKFSCMHLWVHGPADDWAKGKDCTGTGIGADSLLSCQQCYHSQRAQQIPAMRLQPNDEALLRQQDGANQEHRSPEVAGEEMQNIGGIDAEPS